MMPATKPMMISQRMPMGCLPNYVRAGNAGHETLVPAFALTRYGGQIQKKACGDTLLPRNTLRSSPRKRGSRAAWHNLSFVMPGFVPGIHVFV